MSELKEASKALAFCSVLYREDLWSEKQLQELLLGVGLRGDLYFDHNYDSMHSYYDREMGAPLSRFFITDLGPRERSYLIELKCAADSLEKKYSSEGLRSFNFDPGLITMEQVILATGKPYAHRPYLDKGIYAELTYFWEAGHWRPFAWTYPDYVHSSACEYFELAREMLKEQLSP